MTPLNTPNGAVVFGRSPNFSWNWPNEGEPEPGREHDTDDRRDVSDSWLGTSINTPSVDPDASESRSASTRITNTVSSSFALEHSDGPAVSEKDQEKAWNSVINLQIPHAVGSLSNSGHSGDMPTAVSLHKVVSQSGANFSPQSQAESESGPIEDLEANVSEPAQSQKVDERNPLAEPKKEKESRC